MKPKDKPRQRAFLKAYSVSGNVVKAAEAAKVDRTMHYRWLADPQYAARFENARGEFGDLLEAAAMARAHEGVLEPVYYKGTVCGAIRRYSDGLAQFLLRGLKPETYRERQEITGKDGGPIESRLELVFVGPPANPE